jgi:hypothetical protein
VERLALIIFGGSGEVARINFEDDVEAQDEFWKLLDLVGGNRDLALGKLLRFFRLAQKAWGYDQPMAREDLESKGFGDMIQSGWAVPVPGGFHALGAKVHFAWYRQKVEAGKLGGRPKKEDTPDSENNRTVSADNRDTDSANPLALALAPAPVPVLVPSEKKENIYARAEIQPEAFAECLEEWKATLKHFEIERSLGERDQLEIARAIQRDGPEWVKLAFQGARKQKAEKNFDPKQFVSLRIYLDPKRIERLVNIGSGKESADGTDWVKVFGSSA